MKKLLSLSLMTIFTSLNININAHAHFGIGFNFEIEDDFNESYFDSLNFEFGISDCRYRAPITYRQHRTFPEPIFVTRPVIIARTFRQPVFKPTYRPIIIEHIERPVFDEPIYVERSRQVIYSDDYCDLDDLEEAQMARLAKKTAKRHEQKLVVEKELRRQEVERRARREKEIKQKIANQKALLENAEKNIEDLESELNRICK